MLSKYLSMDPVPWLIDGINPAVRYHVKTEILKQSDPDDDYTELLNSDLTLYFNRNFSNGALGDFKRLDMYYKGSIWFFLYAVESGYKMSSDFISFSADHICKQIQLDDGGFKFNFKSSEAVGCRTGNMVYSLLKSGISDSRTAKGLDWIIKNQREDGGWLHCPITGFCDVMKVIILNKSGNKLKYETDSSVISCPVASYSCLQALSLLNNNTSRVSKERGADYFIRNDFFINSNEKTLCGNRVNFKKIGYPIMSQYDYLSGMILISKIKVNDFSSKVELFNRLIKNQNQDGSWNCDNRLKGMVFEEKSNKSRWTTLNVLRLLITIDKSKYQFENA